MARVVILGAGISGHTAALVLRRRLAPEHEVLVVTPNRQWNWIPSNIWVGVGTATSSPSASLSHRLISCRGHARPRTAP